MLAFTMTCLHEAMLKYHFCWNSLSSVPLFQFLPKMFPIKFSNFYRDQSGVKLQDSDLEHSRY